MERENPVKAEIGVLKTKDHVYAVNKSGDFSKPSAKEPWWPQDAAGKRPIIDVIEDLNIGKSLGAMRINVAVSQQIKLGALPRGMRDTLSVNSHDDSDRGVVLLEPESLNEMEEKRLSEQLDHILGTAHNRPSTLPWTPKYAKVFDPNQDKKKKIPSSLPAPLPVVGYDPDVVPLDTEPTKANVIKINIPEFNGVKILD